MTNRNFSNAPETGTPRNGMKEVAERAGVAISSVSRVLSGHPDVSEVMRNRVLDAVASLGYEPNILAQSMRTGETKTIAFIVSDISNPLISEIALGAEITLREAGYSMLVVNSMNSPSLELEHISLMKRRRIDGMLLSLADEKYQELPIVLANLDRPVVLVDRRLKDFDPDRVVFSDHRLGMTEALEHLYEIGHRSIALINGSLSVRPSRQRAKAVRKFGREHPDAHCVVQSGSFTGDFGYEATRELLGSTARPTALIAGSNQILVGVLRALRELQVNVPADISLVTCDDSALAEYMSPALDTIMRDPKALGMQAANTLLALLRKQPVERQSLPTHYHQRASSAPPSTR